MASTIQSCPTCSYPISVSAPGEVHTCPNCGQISQAIGAGLGVTGSILLGAGMFILGIIVGPAVTSEVVPGVQKRLSAYAGERVNR